MDRVPNTIDRSVGMRVRERRCELGMTQQKLAEAVGVTFQQLQKYEGGKNRITAGRLYQLAVALGVEVGYFFEKAEIATATRKPRAKAGD
jgi:transcriptional regulator with XRE-family HTH domain